MSKNTVKKYVDGLVEKRLITTEPTYVITKKGEKRNGNLLYHIRPIEEAVEYHYEQQMIRLDEETRRQTALTKLAEYDQKRPKIAVIRHQRKQVKVRGLSSPHIPQRTAEPTALTGVLRKNNRGLSKKETK